MVSGSEAARLIKSRARQVLDQSPFGQGADTGFMLPNPDDGPLAYTEAGFGHSLVFLPPLGCTKEIFADQLAPFARDHRTIAVDLRGNGESPELDVPVQRVLRTQAHDLVNLFDQLNVPRAHVVGVGYGGAVAQRLALDHPRRVRSLVLCDTWGDAAAHSTGERVARFAAGTSPLAYRLPKQMVAASHRTTYLRWPHAGQVMIDQLDHLRHGELGLQHRAYAGLRQARELRRLERRALCLAGDAAPWMVTLGQRLAATIPDSRFERIPDAMLPSHLCQPEVFNELVRAWIDPENWTPAASD